MRVTPSQILARIPPSQIGRDYPGVEIAGASLVSALAPSAQIASLLIDKGGPAEIIIKIVGPERYSAPAERLGDLLAAAMISAAHDPAGFRFAVASWTTMLNGMAREDGRREIRPSVLREITAAERALRLTVTLALLAAWTMRNGTKGRA